MKIKDGFMLREVAGAYVVVPVGGRADDFNGMIHLNETGAFFWKLVSGGADRQEMIDKGLAEYDVAPEKIAEDVDRFIGVLKDNSLLQES